MYNTKSDIRNTPNVYPLHLMMMMMITAITEEKKSRLMSGCCQEEKLKWISFTIFFSFNLDKILLYNLINLSSVWIFFGIHLRGWQMNTWSALLSRAAEINRGKIDLDISSPAPSALIRSQARGAYKSAHSDWLSDVRIRVSWEIAKYSGWTIF